MCPLLSAPLASARRILLGRHTRRRRHPAAGMPLRAGRAGNERVDLLLLTEDTGDGSNCRTGLAVARLLCCDVRPGRAGLARFSFSSQSTSPRLDLAFTEDWRIRLGPQLESSLASSSAHSFKSVLRASLVAFQDKAFSGQLKEVAVLLSTCPEHLDEDALQPLFSLSHAKNARCGAAAALSLRLLWHLGIYTASAMSPAPRCRAEGAAAHRIRSHLPPG